MAVLYAFFSYTHFERDIDPDLFKLASEVLAARVSAQFADHELRVWQDKNIRTGEDWNDTIEANLRDSKLLIVMLSPRWIGSAYCRKEFTIFREVEAKLNNQKLVAPILVREVARDELSPEQLAVYDDLSKRQYKSLLVTEFLALDDDDRELRMEQLARELAKTLKPHFAAATVRIPQPAPPQSPVIAKPEAAPLPPVTAPPMSPIVMTKRGGLGGLFKNFATAAFNKLPGLFGGIVSHDIGAPIPDLDDWLSSVPHESGTTGEGVDDAAVEAAPATAPHTLPLVSLGSLFMGREQALADIAATLKEQPALVLRGMGGVGKTRAAIEYAWRHNNDYAALLFVSAETPQLLNAALASLATTLDLPEKDVSQDPVKTEAVLRWLAANSGWLLILDNVDDEHAAAAVAELLPKLASGKTIITARYDKFPPGVKLLPLGVLQPEPARDFLLARAEGRQIADDDATRAAELAKELGYLALALEQAGAFIALQKVSFERYLAYWRDETVRAIIPFDKNASGGTRDVGIAGVFGTSVARLSANGRRLLDRIAFLAPEPIPEFLLDVAVPSSFETPPSAAPQDEGTESAAPPFSHEVGEGGPRVSEGRMRADAAPANQGPSPDPTSSGHPLPLRGRGEHTPFDARAALAELYAYSLAAPTEIEGRYAQPAFVVHRLVQDYARACMDKARRAAMLREALAWIDNAFDDDPGDVRNWARLDPFAVHARAVAEAADNAGLAEPTARLMNQIGLLLSAQARWDEAESLYRRALEIDGKSLGPDHPNVAIRLNNLALLLKATDRLDEAEPLYRRALAIGEASYGPDHPDVAHYLNNFAILLQDTNRLDEAEPLIRRALDIGEKSFGPNHPEAARRLNNLALLLKQTNRLGEAEPLYRRALDINEKRLGPDHPEVATNLNNLAELLRDTNRLAEAEPLHRRALSIREASFGSNHPDVAASLNNLADLLRDTNRLAEAEPLMRRALEIDEASFGRDHPDVASDLNNLAVLLEARNHLAEAELLYFHAMSIFAASFGPEHPRTKNAANNYRILLRELGASEEEATAKVAAALRRE